MKKLLGFHKEQIKYYRKSGKFVKTVQKVRKKINNLEKNKKERKIEGGRF